MTATASSPPLHTGPPPASGSGEREPAAGRGPWLGVPAELSLWLLSGVVAFGFGRLFTDRSFLVPVLVAVACSHMTALVLRRLRVPLVVAAVGSLVVMAVALSWLFYPATLRYGLPGRPTWDRFAFDVRDAVDRFRGEKAPVEAAPGFVAGSAIGFWLSAFLADWSAFRLRASVEATIPAGSLFVFASLLGADQGRLVATATFFGAASAFVLLHRASRLEVSPSWVRGHGPRGAGAIVRSGAVVVLAAMALVAAAGPFVPGADGSGLIDIRDLGNDNGRRVTLSPLVDIRQRLVDQRETVAFTVTSDQRSYWRLTALDEFDGRTWRSSNRFTEVRGALPHDSVRAGAFRSVQQRFTIAGLAQIWLPAAYEAQVVADADRSVRWDPGTSTLIVDADTSNGMSYSVESALPLFDAAQLRAARGQVPAEVQRQYLGLPQAFPSSVQELAERIVQDAPTAYDAALALQRFFRANFTYSTDVPGGQSIDAIEDFLFSPARAGYCEQFAGSFAAMARSVGLPARVAVGFTTGDADPGRADTYVVRGKHAHAWPEVYLAGAGWVLFEPTPGRGAPNAPYTGTVEQQDSTVAQAEPATTTTTTADGESQEAADAPAPSTPAEAAPAAAEAAQPSLGEAPGRSTGRSVGAAAAVALLAYLVGVPVGRRWWRGRRRRRAVDPGARVDLAWAEVVGALRLVGVMARPGDTPAELAARALDVTDGEIDVHELAGLVVAGRYAPQGAGVADADRACVLAATALSAVRRRTTAVRRYLAEIDPRTLLR